MSARVIGSDLGERVAVQRLSSGDVDLLVTAPRPPYELTTEERAAFGCRFGELWSGQLARLRPAQAERLLDALAIELGLPENAAGQLRAIAAAGA